MNLTNRFHPADVYVVVEEDRGMGVTPIAAYASCSRAHEECGSNRFVERITVFAEDDATEQVFGYEIATIPYFA